MKRMTLPENTLAVGVDGMTAALDPTGAGYAFWSTTGTDLNARRFAAGAWAGPAASYAPGDGVTGKLSATILPNGDAYVVYSYVNAGQGLRGIRVSSSGGAVAFGTTDDLASGKAILKLTSLAAADGETTVLYSESDGLGTITTSARRGAPGAFGAAAPLGADPGEYMSASIDAAGHITMLRNTSALDGALHHHRIAHGATTWTAAKRIDAASGTGTVRNYTAVAHLPNGDPIAVWQDTKDLKYTVCH